MPSKNEATTCCCGDASCVIPYGLCHCGCGGQTRMASKSDRSSFRVEGAPVRFISGHGRRRPPCLSEASPFKIDGVYCRLVPLSKGQHAIVDAADYEWLMQWKWHAIYIKKTNTHYAVRTSHQGSPILMHRQILGLTGGKMQGDHKNRETIDNRRQNLRIATNAQNSWNSRPRKAKSIKGIYLDRKRNKWVAGINHDGKSHYIGSYETPESAGDGYLAEAKKHFGQFARNKE